MKLQSCKFHVFGECKLANSQSATIERTRLCARSLNEMNIFLVFSNAISGRTPPLGADFLPQYLVTTLACEIVWGIVCGPGLAGLKQSRRAAGTAAATAAAAGVDTWRGSPWAATAAAAT